MAFLSLLLTFLLEQLRPVPARGALADGIHGAVDAAERHLNAGEPHHGAIAWWLLVGGCTLVTLLVYWVLLSISLLLALAFTVAVLYLTIGFRQFSHPFTAVRLALANGDLDGARRELADWKRIEDPAFDATLLEVGEVVRQTLELGLRQTHRHVFGVMLWFALFAWLVGPAGAVFYRLAEVVARRWNRPPVPGGPPPDRFGEFAARAIAWIDWLPARLSALGFAAAGDFEGAVYCWRRVARRVSPDPWLPAPDSRSLLLAAASGALGVRLMSAADSVRDFDEPGQEGAGLAEPQPAALDAGAALMWRAVILWIGLFALLSVASWMT